LIPGQAGNDQKGDRAIFQHPARIAAAWILAALPLIISFNIIWAKESIMKYNRFEEVPVWQDAIKLAKAVYALRAYPELEGK